MKCKAYLCIVSFAFTYILFRGWTVIYNLVVNILCVLLFNFYAERVLIKIGIILAFELTWI